jgi:hypothetical protein
MITGVDRAHDRKSDFADTCCDVQLESHRAGNDGGLLDLMPRPWKRRALHLPVTTVRAWGAQRRLHRTSANADRLRRRHCRAQ